MAPVNGTPSATVIQSMPSMKLTRLTNHTPPTNRHSALDPPGQDRQDVPFRRQRGDQGADGEALQHEPRHCRQGADVVDGADQGEQDRCRGWHQEWPASVVTEGRQESGCAPSDGERCDDNGDAAALRRRLLM